MQKTKNLELPIYDNPELDVFDLEDWNLANQNIDVAYEEMANFKQDLAKIDANSEIIEARKGKTTLGDKIDEIDSQLEQKAKQVDLVIERNRIDNIVAVKDSVDNLETADIRVGANGKTYSSAGEAVRDQFGTIYNGIYRNSINLLNSKNNKVGKDLITWQTTVTLDNCTYDSANVTTLAPIKCKEGEVYSFFKFHPTISNKVQSQSATNILYFDELGKYVEKNNNLSTITIPKGASSFMASVPTSNLIVMIVKTNDTTNKDFEEYGQLLNVYTKENVYTKDETKSLLKARKSAILLNFDDTQTIYSDGRYDLVYKEYGFPFTFNVGLSSTNTILPMPTQEQIAEMMENGCDVGTYNKYGRPTDTEFDNESLDWDSYIGDIYREAQKVGVFNPTVWMSQHNRTGVAMNEVLKKYGYKVCRGYKYGTDESAEVFIKDWNKDNFNAVCVGLYPSAKDKILGYIDTAIANSWDLSIITHKFYLTNEEAETNFGCTEAIYREILEKIKSYVNQGKCEVITYREWYRKIEKDDGYENDYRRQLKYAKFLTTK